MYCWNCVHVYDAYAYKSNHNDKPTTTCGTTPCGPVKGARRNNRWGWWPGDAKSQIICSHVIGPFLLEHSSHRTRRVKFVRLVFNEYAGAFFAQVAKYLVVDHVFPLVIVVGESKPFWSFPIYLS